MQCPNNVFSHLQIHTTQWLSEAEEGGQPGLTVDLEIMRMFWNYNSGNDCMTF